MISWKDLCIHNYSIKSHKSATTELTKQENQEIKGIIAYKYDIPAKLDHVEFWKHTCNQ